MKKKISAILICMMIISLVSGCGKEEDPYSSPNFSDKSPDVATEADATVTDASINDALMIASFTDATMTDASATDAVPASLTDALPMGVYQDNTYYNGLAEFKIIVDGEKWKLYDAVEVASATGATPDYVSNLWFGYTSPFDEDTTYAAIASNKESGSTIIVSYISPTSYNMPDYSAKDYLGMVAGRYEDVSVRTVTFLAQTYECIDIPQEDTGIGRRVQFAIDRGGMIILITFTIYDDTTLEEAVGLLKPLYY